MIESLKKLQSGMGPKGQLKYMRAYLLCKQVLKIRGARKELSSYLNMKLDRDSRVRQTMTVGGTKTWRFTHSKTLWDTGCNFATVPRDVRRAFIADEGKVLAEFDLHRGESWFYAHLADDEEMMRILRENEDFHAISASAISGAFGDSVSVDKLFEGLAIDEKWAYKLRYLGKRWNHSAAYRGSGYTLANSVNEESEDTGITCTQAQAEKGLRLWLLKYPGILAWHEQIEQDLANSRMLTTPYGQVRRFHGVWNNKLFRDATAHVPQASSVHYLNRGLYDVWREYDLAGSGKVELLHQQHDSILVQFDENDVDELMPKVAEALRSEVVVNGHEISVPIEGSWGHNWREMTEWKLAA
jgi:DNA polymerase-1